MKIREIYVSRFGCLQDYRVTFSEGLNVLQENNGFGKTTLATFLKAVFYSLPYTRSASLEDNELKKCRPWNSNEKFGGWVTFTHNDKDFRLERRFGSTQKDEAAYLIDLSTNVKQDVTNRQDLGKRLFGLDAAAFERCLYLPQKRVEIKPNDSFTEKLNNLTASDDDNNYTAAINNLREFSKKLKLERGNGGLIYEAEREKMRLTALLDEQKRTTCELEHNRRETVSTLSSLDETIKKLSQAENRISLLEKNREPAESEKLRQLLRDRETELAARLSETSQKIQQLPEQKNTAKVLAASKTALILLIVGAILMLIGSVVSFCTHESTLGGILLAPFAAVVVAVLLLLSSRRRQKQKSEAAQTERNALFEEKDRISSELAKVRKDLEQATAATGNFDQNEYRRMVEYRDKLISDKTHLQSRLVGLQKDAEWMTKNQGDVADTMNSLDAAEARLDRLRRKYDRAQTAMRLLRDAKETLSKAYAPKLRENFSNLLACVTGGQLTDGLVGAEDFRTEILCDGATRDMAYFSQGLKELAGFCLRLALIQTIYGDQPPLLILDDPFVNLDDNNLLRASKLLKSMSEKTQIVLLTCTDRFSAISR